MMKQQVISADSHVIEPPDLWLSHIEPEFRDCAPRVVHDEHEKMDRWVCEGATPHTIRELIGVGREFTDSIRSGRYETDVLPGGYDPDARLKDMATDGVSGEVVYPTVALRMFTVPDSGFQGALFRAYNTWVADYCGRHADRLKGIGAIAMGDIDAAVAELHRCKDLGLSGVLIALEGSEHHLPQYHPFWASAVSLGMPVSLHVETGRVMGQETRIDLIVYSVHIQRVLVAMIYSGLFDKFPDLKLVCVESEAGWAGHMLDRMDFFYHLHGENRKNREILCDRPPSEIMRDSVHYTIIKDATGIAIRKILGENNIMWSSDFPHSGSTWPHSREVIAEQFAGVPEDDKVKMISGNAARLYGFG